MKSIIILSFLVLGIEFFISAQNDEPKADTVQKVSTIYNQLWIEGQYGVYYKISERIDSNLITRPYIIAEGIDPTNSNEIPYVYSSIDNFDGNINFLQALRQQGYDILVLNFKQTEHKIEENAELIKALIRKINKELENNDDSIRIAQIREENGIPNYTSRIKIMGISMGGLVVSYALASMETDNEDHKCELMMTFDTPHKGANVPLGYQMLVNEFAGSAIKYNNLNAGIPSFFQNFNPIDKLDKLLAKEIGLSFFTQASGVQMSLNFTEPNYARKTYLYNVSKVGEFPNNCRRVGLSNGANRINQPNLNKSSELFTYRNGECVLDKQVAGVNLKWCPLGANVTVWAMPGREELPGVVSSMTFSSQLYINEKVFATPGLIGNIYAGPRGVRYDALNAPKDMNVDHVPGGYFKLGLFEDFRTEFNENRYVDIKVEWTFNKTIKVPCAEKKCRNIGSLGKVCGYPPSFCDRQVKLNLLSFNHRIEHLYGTVGGVDPEYRFCFIPTIGALDVHSDDWHLDLTEIGNYPKRGRSSFDAIYWHSENTFHAHMPDNDEDGNAMANFMHSELDPSRLYIQNRTFENNYKNTFYGRLSISLGKNVDPIPNKTDVGAVTLKSNAGILLVSNDVNGQIDFEDGFDSDNGNFETEFIPFLVPAPNVNTENFLPQPNPIARVAVAEEIVNEDEILAVNNGAIGNTIDNEVTNLLTAYPNPFSSSSKLEFTLTETSNVTLKVRDSFGQYVRTFMEDKSLVEGKYELDFNGGALKQGFYYAELLVNATITHLRLILE